METQFIKLPPPVSYHKFLEIPFAANKVWKVLSAEDFFLDRY